MTRFYKYHNKFGDNREKAILRDGERCVKCGMTRQEHREKYGRDITVDHIDNNGISKPRTEKNNDLDNLQTLCLSCHSSKDNRLRKLTDMQALNIFHVRDDPKSVSLLCELYGVNRKAFHAIMTGQTHRNVTHIELKGGIKPNYKPISQRENRNLINYRGRWFFRVMRNGVRIEEKYRTREEAVAARERFFELKETL